MASNYSANQFEKSFDPKRLGNWEANTKPAVRPKSKFTTTKIIAGENGHLLPGIPRRNENPWITLNRAECYHKQKRTNDNANQRKSASQISQRLKCQKVNDHPVNKENELAQESENTEGNCNKRHAENYEIVNPDCSPPEIVNEQIVDRKSPSLHSESSFPIVNCFNDNAKVKSETFQNEPLLADAYCDAVIAKSLKSNHQQHHALPDMKLNDKLRLPRSQTKNKIDSPKTVSANEKEYADSAICFKGFGPPGPTQCTKLKVYRPKTTNDNKKRLSISSDSDVAKRRPKTCSKQTTAKKKPLTEMDLAIYWDITPIEQDHLSHCKPTAPAVFTTVHNDIDDYQKQINDMDIPSSVSCQSGHNSSLADSQQKLIKKLNERNNSVLSHRSAVMNVVDKYRSRRQHKIEPSDVSAAVPVVNDTLVARKSNDSAIIKLERQLKNIRQSSAKSIDSTISSRIGRSASPVSPVNGVKQFDNTEQIRHVVNNSDKSFKTTKPLIGEVPTTDGKSNAVENIHKERRCESDSNLMNIMTDGKVTSQVESNEWKKCIEPLNNRRLRTCVACEAKNFPENKVPFLKNENYKMAFKAGKLNNLNKEAVEQKMQRLKTLRVPKPKVPFVKKSYSIATLIPPFSIWPIVTGQDYPDHWRLASVYQHSYKPIQSRKSQLIKTVFL